MPELQKTSLFSAKQQQDLKNSKKYSLDKTTTKNLDKELDKKIDELSKNNAFSDNALEILAKRYLVKDKDNNPTEKPGELFKRVAKTIASTDLLYGKTEEEIGQTTIDFYKMMTRLEFFPNSPTIRGAGREIHQLSACFVLPIEDSMEGIFDTLKITSLVHKGGGGTGFSFGRLRPKGDKVGSTGGIAGGPISFMRIYDVMAQEVMQGGVRVGANMGILPVNHPDIIEFISCKINGTDFRNFNISVSVTDKFMQAVEEDKEYELVNPKTKQVTGKLKAKDVFEKMTKNAWENGDPGIIFIDEMNKYNPTPNIGTIESTNPCGEQPLLPFESCNLGSINLAVIVKDKDINWRRLGEITRTAVHFLDNVIDINRFADPRIEKTTKGNRKIGLGVMGFADMLVQLNIPYASNKALETAEKVMKFINDEGHKASEQLAKERGIFLNFKGSMYDKNGKAEMRNATVTTIAPTGTLSLLADCNGGIEPFFALVYKKKSIWNKDGSSELEQVFVNKYFEKVAEERGFYSKELMEKIADEGSLHDINEVPDDVKKIFVTSHDISPEWHIKMQAAFQKYTDNAVSKTINFPNNVTVDDVRNSYLLAYKTKCKGITIYRDGSRDKQVMTTGKSEKTMQQQTTALAKISPRERPDVVKGSTYRIKTGYGTLYVTVNEDENNEPFEVFAQIGKAGGFFAAKVEAISRLISLALRSGIGINEVIDQLKGIRGPSPAWTEEGMILSLPDAIAKILEKQTNKEQIPLEFSSKVKKVKNEKGFDISRQKAIADFGIAPACPECGSILKIGEGCLTCASCGYSKCN